MEEWLHCNLCFVRVVERKCLFSLTNCGHIFCQQCIKKASSPACVVCRKQCSVVELNDKLDESVVVFFKSPEDMEKKARHLQKVAQEVRQFQAAQRKSLLSGFSSKVKQDTELLHRSRQRIELQAKEINELKRIINKIKGSMSSLSPNRHSVAMASPERSPQTTPVTSPRRLTPGSQSARLRTPPRHYSSVPSTPCKSFTSSTPISKDYHHVAQSSSVHKAHISPGDRRLSIRSPPVQGKVYSPSSRSPTPQQGYRSHDGVVSKMASRNPSPSIHGYVDISPAGAFTPPTTPKMHLVGSTSKRYTPHRP